jgi:hypothetical protein
MNKVCSNLFEYELVEANKKTKSIIARGELNAFPSTIENLLLILPVKNNYSIPR